MTDTADTTGQPEQPQQPQHVEPPEPEVIKPPWWRTPKLIIPIAAGVVVALAAVIVAVTLNAQGPFEAAIEECGLEESAYVRLGDEGRTLVVDMEGDDSAGVHYIEAICITHVLDVPDSTMERMDRTRALDGIQTDEFNGIEVRWSYPPDSGLDMIFTR